MGYDNIEKLLKALEKLDKEKEFSNLLSEPEGIVREWGPLIEKTKASIEVTIMRSELPILVIAIGNQIRENIGCLFPGEDGREKLPSESEIRETVQFINFLLKLLYQAGKERWLDDGITDEAKMLPLLMAEVLIELQFVMERHVEEKSQV